MLPDEIVIADDGSHDDTAEMIQTLAKTSPTSILHAWQPNEGFRAARSRNNGIALSSGEYLIFLDGDCFLNPYFIEDHLGFALPGQFVGGTRINILPARKEYILRTRNTKISCFSWGTRKKLNAIRSAWLSRFSYRGKLASANLAVWRPDLVALNGFNEQFIGHGGEDHDLTLRLEMAGLASRKLRHLAMAYHFAHANHPHGDAVRIREIFEETRREKKIRCEFGLDRAVNAHTEKEIDGKLCTVRFQ